jgi:hypothetical protein
MSMITKQQVVAALKEGFMGTDSPSRTAIIETLADILVRAGLVEGPRGEGRYQVRWHPGSVWQEAIWNGESWSTPTRPDDCRASWRHEVGVPYKIGPRILPPAEE